MERTNLLDGLRYCGHPLVDVGIATILAFSNKKDLSQLAQSDLDSISDWMAHNYVRNPLKSFLTVVFMNSGYVQPAFARQPEKREAYCASVLSAYRLPTLAERDAFLNLPVADVSLDADGKLPAGRAYRQHIPLFTGQGTVNFVPEGIPGLPISGLALLAIQAMPLGCVKCGGKLLAIHSDNRFIIEAMAKANLAQNRKLLALAQEAGESKIPEPPQTPRTLLVDSLLRAERELREWQYDSEPYSITAYHLSSSGQSPSLTVYSLPVQMAGFLRQMHTATHRQAWGQVVSSAWQRPKSSKARDADFQPRYNAIYEDLFTLPERSGQFIRTYLLRIPRRRGLDKQDPRLEYSTSRECAYVDWGITSEFLRRIMNMEPERIESIRTLGDGLADYIQEVNDRRFFRALYTARQYWVLRNALLRASLANVRRGKPPVVSFDQYIGVFEEGADLPHVDWRLARDLVLIRVIEHLHGGGWLNAHADALPETEKDIESDGEE